MKKEEIKYILQKCKVMKRNDEFYEKFVKDNYDNLKFKIAKDTNWLTASTSYGSETRDLPFHEQAIKYYEYKNMVIQRRSQYVIIFLTITLLIMTGLEIYFNFLK